MRIEDKLKRYAPVTLPAPLDRLSPDVRRALPHLVKAMKGIDAVYHQQLGEGIPEHIAAQGEADEGRAASLRFFNGPYDMLTHEPLWADAPPLRPGRGVYPADLSATELDAYLQAHPSAASALLSPYTQVTRDGDALKAVPYAEHYAEALRPVIEGLRAAAEEIEDEALSGFLKGRAAALAGERSIIESDADWVRLKAPALEVVIGPFEVYEDDLKGVKAFHEAMLLMTDAEAGARLASIEAALPTLAAAIPTPAGARPAIGGLAPMIIADELLTAGEGRAGVLSSAFNLPNDPGVRGEVGWKQVMIRNVMEAKFNHCTRPIAEIVLSEADLAATSFDAYFFHVLLHEVSHGLGPAYRADGRPVNEVCGPGYTSIEEAKADTGALVLLLKYNGQFGIPAMPARTIGASYFAGFFRSIRFGVGRAHGRANIIQYNFLRDQGAWTPDGAVMRVDTDKLLSGGEALLYELTRLQAEGSEAEINAFIERWGQIPEEVSARLAQLEAIPIDINPTFALDEDG
ncbi:hypothetical protein KKF91_05565 [Myxococcota bacterium]|nr:hypothetical protein [Myxococcota bacterium]MBU1430017.1 hypothetical protein [Myxococcota bacterium]MBU1899856.1 hypothetical protein [Myxococcota bacterium]